MAGDINIGLRRASRDEPQYGFIINRCDKRNWFEAETRGPSDGYRTGVYINGKQPSVLSNDIQLAESPERWIPSLIRFQVFDKAAFVVGKCLYEFGSLVPTFPISRQTGSDGKLNLFIPSYAETACQRRGENIEAASDGVDVGARFDDEAERQKLFFDRYHHLIRGVALNVDNVGIDVVAQPGIDLGLEGWEVGYGPINTCYCV
jgi:hypothetical protein